MAADHAVLAVHRHAGEVADVLVGAGQLIEKRRLTAVLVADEGKAQHRSVRQRIAAALRMELSFLAETGVSRFSAFRPFFLFRRPLDFADLDLLRVCQTQRQLVAVDAQLHRVAHRRELDQRDLGARDHAHIEEVLPQRALSPDALDAGRLPRFQFVESHILFSLPQIWRIGLSPVRHHSSMLLYSLFPDPARYAPDSLRFFTAAGKKTALRFGSNRRADRRSIFSCRAAARDRRRHSRRYRPG